MTAQNTEPTATSLAGVARVFGCHPDTAKTWKAQGMPGTTGNYRLSAIYRWLHGPDGPRGEKLNPKFVDECYDNLQDAARDFEREWLPIQPLALDDASRGQLLRAANLAAAITNYLESKAAVSVIAGDLRWPASYVSSAIDGIRRAAGDLPEETSDA